MSALDDGLWTRLFEEHDAQLTAANGYCTAHMGFPGLPLQLSEERGPFTAEIFANDTQNDFCLVGPSFSNSSGFQTSSPVQVPAGQLFLWGDHAFDDADEPYGTVIARAANDVTAVTFTLDDVTQVAATLQNGWVVAWWPGSQQLAGAQLTTPAGTQTQTFPRGECAVHNCSGGGAHGRRALPGRCARQHVLPVHGRLAAAPAPAARRDPLPLPARSSRPATAAVTVTPAISTTSAHRTSSGTTPTSPRSASAH